MRTWLFSNSIFIFQFPLALILNGNDWIASSFVLEWLGRTYYAHGTSLLPTALLWRHVCVEVIIFNKTWAEIVGKKRRAESVRRVGAGDREPGGGCSYSLSRTNSGRPVVWREKSAEWTLNHETIFSHRQRSNIAKGNTSRMGQIFDYPELSVIYPLVSGNCFSPYGPDF